MDSKKAEALRKKYWDGKSTLDEEQRLKSSYLPEEDPESAYFNFLKEQKAQDPLGDKFDQAILDQIREGERKLTPKIGIWCQQPTFGTCSSTSSPGAEAHRDRFKPPNGALLS